MFRLTSALLALPAALAAAAAVAQAQPIFTTAPPHLQGIVAKQDNRQQGRPAAPPAGGGGMLPIPGMSNPAFRPQTATTSAASPRKPAKAADRRAAVPGKTNKAAIRPAVKDTEDDAPEGSTASKAIVRHLTNNIQGFRLSGEIAALEWPVFFTQAQ
ncbi:MAG: hypothetical protein AB7J19_18530, partial [Beijerinckiaceae bacterium]